MPCGSSSREPEPNQKFSAAVLGAAMRAAAAGPREGRQVNQRPGTTIPSVDFGGAGPPLHFAHANGFPAGCYRSFLTGLTGRYRVVASEHRALWDAAPPPPRRRRWRVFADDLIDFLDARFPGEAVVGVGHSMGGATTVMAAARAPARFRALVLIDPVFLPPAVVGLFTAAPWLARRLPHLQAAARRVERFPDHAAAFASYRRRRFFAGLSDEVLRDCVAAMFSPEVGGEGLRLRFPKLWEVAVFSAIPRVWGPLGRVAGRVPMIGLRGATSDVLGPTAWRRWGRVTPGATLSEVPGVGHLLPLERPGALAETILGHLAAT